MSDFFDNRYFYINKFFLSCIGQWPFHSARRNFIIQFFIFFALLICLVTTGAGFLRAWGDSDKMIECLPTIFTAIGCLVYCIIYLSKQKKLGRLFHEIKRDWEYWSSDREQLIIFNHANHGRIYTIFYTGCISGTLLTYLLMAVTPQFLDIVLPLNESRPKNLPFQMYYFCNYSEDYFYWIMLHISFNAIVEMCILIGSESILAVFTEHACALFKIIGLQLKKINSNDSEGNNLKAVIFCIEQHNRAIEFCTIIESLFSPCFFFIMGLNTILISASLIQVVVNLNKIDIAVRFGAFTGASIAHLFLNSLPAQRLMDYSANLADNLYDSSWYQMPVKIRKLLLLIMMRSRVPCKLTAGKMLDLSLRSVCSILQASFSYFTLLSTMTT
ncbi:putative odorant receptor 85d [Leptopilina boulardi]|uniref:putative odorant receptor 85d n=1 Tax=Leptopilina boulardi TaxID=63433 RepID=UPI0021F5A37B|nr:putative odorant receptor 85d [Leptopilina boulardi]